MSKPIDIISRALKDIGALEAGEVPTPDAAQDAFDMLNGKLLLLQAGVKDREDFLLKRLYI